MYIFSSLDSALVGLSHKLLRFGVKRSTRGFNCIELPSPIIVCIDNPSARYVTIPERKWNKTLPFIESLWIALGLNDLDVLPGKYVKNLYNYSDDGHTWRACLTGDTKIMMLDGSHEMIKDLVGKEFFWVYSKDKTGRVVPGKAHSAIKTKTVTKICEVTLDNGEVVKCTLDHRFRLLNGEYKEAQYLDKNDSLSPLYIRESSAWGYKWGGYLECKDDNNKYVLLHKRVGEFLENKISYEDKPQLHHIDLNRKNNSPDNLMWLTNIEHRRIHAELARNFIKEKKLTDNSFKEKCDSSSKENLKLAIEKNKNLLSSNDGDYIRDVRKKNMEKLNSDKNFSKKALWGKIFKIFDNIESIGITEENYEKFRKKGVGVPTWGKMIKHFGSLENAILFRNNRENHKIEKVEIIDLVEGVDVYDLTVDNYHNFALEAGVFVHNSYGPRIRSFTGITSDYNTVSIPQWRHLYSGVTGSVDQLKFVIESLKRDINTRQALITISDPPKDTFKDGELIVTKDMPCTRSLHFQVNTEGNLDMITHIRSNDVIFGFSAVNVFNFTLMQEYVANIVGVPVGKYYHIIDNLHFYEDKIELVEKISTKYSNYTFLKEEPFYYKDRIGSLEEFDEFLNTLFEYEQEVSSTKNHFQLNVCGLPDMFIDWANVIYKYWSKKDVEFINPYLNNLFYGK